MNNVKKLKKDIQLDEEEVQGQEATRMTFDVYFQKLMRIGSNIYLHHKAPMRQYAESKGLIGAVTEAEFDDAFRDY